MIAIDTELRREIRAVMVDRDTPAFDRRRKIADLVTEALSSAGQFCRTRDGRLFFFSVPERQLYDLEQRGFQHLVTILSGLSAIEHTFKFVIDMLQATAARTAPTVEVHTLAFYDPTANLLAVSDGGPGVWLRERHGAWTQTHNGAAGLLFLTAPEAAPWIPELDADASHLAWFFDGFLFGEAPLSREDQVTLLLTFLLQQFFPPLRRTRVLPAFLGPQGSGKTSAMRRLGHLLLGPRFEVTGLERADRGEAAFVAAVTNAPVCAFDNADSRIPWLDDKLATYATGNRYTLRRLYVTNELATYDSRAVILIASRDPHFRRADVAERLLPLHFDRPEVYRDEGRLLSELEVRRGAVWGALLRQLAAIADRVSDIDSPALRFRMADFAAFGWRVASAFGAATAEWEGLLRRTERAQAAFAAEGDGLMEALRVLLDEERGPLGPIAIGDLFRQCQRVADAESLPLSKDVTGFGRKLTNMKRVIEVELGVRVHEERAHRRKRYLTFVPRARGQA